MGGILSSEAATSLRTSFPTKAKSATPLPEGVKASKILSEKSSLQYPPTTPGTPFPVNSTNPTPIIHKSNFQQDYQVKTSESIGSLDMSIPSDIQDRKKDPSLKSPQSIANKRVNKLPPNSQLENDASLKIQRMFRKKSQAHIQKPSPMTPNSNVESTSKTPKGSVKTNSVKQKKTTPRIQTVLSSDSSQLDIETLSPLSDAPLTLAFSNRNNFTDGYISSPSMSVSKSETQDSLQWKFGSNLKSQMDPSPKKIASRLFSHVEEESSTGAFLPSESGTRQLLCENIPSDRYRAAMRNVEEKILNEQTLLQASGLLDMALSANSFEYFQKV